jgi:hypothetical protein
LTVQITGTKGKKALNEKSGKRKGQKILNIFWNREENLRAIIDKNVRPK